MQALNLGQIGTVVHQRPRPQDDAALAAELHAVRGQLRRRQCPRVQPVGGAVRARRAIRASSCSTRPTQGLPTPPRRARTAAAVRGRGQGDARRQSNASAAGHDLRQRRLGRRAHRARRRESVAVSSFLSGPTPPNGINFAGINNATTSWVRSTRRQDASVPPAASSGSTPSGRSSRPADLAPLMSSPPPTLRQGPEVRGRPAGPAPTSLRLTK